VLELAGRPHEATALLHEALARYERKEALLEPDRIMNRSPRCRLALSRRDSDAMTAGATRSNYGSATHSDLRRMEPKVARLTPPLLHIDPAGQRLLATVGRSTASSSISPPSSAASFRSFRTSRSGGCSRRLGSRSATCRWFGGASGRRIRGTGKRW